MDLPENSGNPLPTLKDYEVLEEKLYVLAKKSPAVWREVVRRQAAGDLYALLRFVSSARDYRDRVTRKRTVCHPFIYSFCQAIQYRYDGVLDIAAREHWKTMLKTRLLSIWKWIADPQELVAIVSVTKDLARDHAKAIAEELETNPLYAALWPDIFWDKPSSKARLWKFDVGYTLKSWPSTFTYSLEAYSLTQSYPVGKHPTHVVVDDISTPSVVSSRALTEQSLKGFDLLTGLESRGATRTTQGTFYADNDPQIELIRQGKVDVRFKPAVDSDDLGDDDEFEDIGGRPVFLTAPELRMKLQRGGAEVYASQYKLDPLFGRRSTFDVEDLRCYHSFPRDEGRSKSIYIVVDPAGWSDLENDPTAIVVYGLGFDRNVYVLDMWKCHADPGERLKKIVSLHSKWCSISRPKEILIEEVAAQSDSHHLRTEMERQGHRFEPRGVQIPRFSTDERGVKRPLRKIERFRNTIQPLLAANRLYLPHDFIADYDGRQVDMTEDYREEISRFPLSQQDHFLATLCVLFSQGSHKKAVPELIFPSSPNVYHDPQTYYPDFNPMPDGERSWLAA